jgi:hypothetical protein
MMKSLMLVLALTAVVAVSATTPKKAAPLGKMPASCKGDACRCPKYLLPREGVQKLVPIPAGINPGLHDLTATYQTAKFGKPTCPLDDSSIGCGILDKSAWFKKNVVQEDIAPIGKVRGTKPFVAAIKTILGNVKADVDKSPAGSELRDLWARLKSAGSYCCRPIKHQDGTFGKAHSNHSWGMAIDLRTYTCADPRGDGKTERGLAMLYPYFNAQRFYWAAAFKGKAEDSMHFHPSKELVEDWIKAKLL